MTAADTLAEGHLTRGHTRALPLHGEIAVVGLGKSGVATVKLLRKHGYSVYASDASHPAGAEQTRQALATLGANVQFGGHDLARIAKAALVVASPGIPPASPPLAVATTHQIEIISEIEVALRCMRPLPYIAVTGTNGKTTTTALIGHLLRSLGYDAVEAGNIGMPLAEVAFRDTPPDWVALELSSFQLHDTPSIDPTVGVLTNLTPDHLDRYPSVDAYYADKARLFANATPSSRWVLNADDPTSRAITATVVGERLYFSVAKDGEPTNSSTGDIAVHDSAVHDSAARYDHSSGQLIILGDSLIARAALPLLGDHNVANALAASLAVMAASADHRTPEARQSIAAALGSFRAPPHRLELVGEWGGVQWINDSKATNVSSAYVAIDGMTRPTVLLLGGRHKGEPYTALTAPIEAHVTHVIAYGEAAPLIARDLDGAVPIETLGGDFSAVMERARALARPGDAVLLSPACSSYDMFANYEERGARFRALARGDG